MREGTRKGQKEKRKEEGRLSSTDFVIVWGRKHCPAAGGGDHDIRDRLHVCVTVFSCVYATVGVCVSLCQCVSCLGPCPSLPG